jgi:hypothetical protein
VEAGHAEVMEGVDVVRLVFEDILEYPDRRLDLALSQHVECDLHRFVIGDGAFLALRFGGGLLVHGLLPIRIYLASGAEKVKAAPPGEERKA